MKALHVVALSGIAVLLAGCYESDRIGEWRKAEVREACFGDVANAHNNKQRLPHGNRIGMRAQLRGEEMAAALRCYVSVNKQAVCEKHNRAYIVDYISRYFTFKRGTYDTAASYGDNERKNVDVFWENSGDTQIMRALADHIENGRLNASDFGWFAPAELKALLADYKGAPDRCTQEVAWRAPAQKYQLPTFEQRLKEMGKH